MKVLILTMLIGAGHNEVARNIAQELKDNGHEVVTYELFKEHKMHNWLIKDLSFVAMSKMPKIANYFYDKALEKDKQPYEDLIKVLKKELVELINDFAPDVIVSTHIAGRMFVKKYQSLFKIPVINYFVVTDYELPPGLKDFDDKDYCVVPNEDFVDKLIKKGMNEKNILPLGIPINPKFFNEISREQVLEELALNIDFNKKIVLVIGGGSGLGNNYQVVKELSTCDNYIILSVAGRNEKLKKEIDRLAKKSQATIISYGFNKQIDYLMKISDVLVGKAGGITSTEAMTKLLPLVVVGKTPRPELSNLEYLISKGTAVSCPSVKEINETLLSIDIESMKNNCKSLLKENPAQKVYEHIISKIDEKVL